MVDFSHSFILQTDVSGGALVAVLSQNHQGIQLPIACASGALMAQEKRASSVYELECLAVVFGIENFSPYIDHWKFNLETDYQVLLWPLSQ
jgi:hypothetical protein